MKEKNFKSKYTIYIKDFSEWITDFSFEYQMSDGYCFQTGQWDSEKNDYVEPLKLTIEEAIWCIVDCVSKYNAYRFKIYPEKEFLKEYEEFKKINPIRFKDIVDWSKGDGVNFDNILQVPKIEKSVDFATINRITFWDYDYKDKEKGLVTYYSLTASDYMEIHSQSKLNKIIECKRPDQSYEFERRDRYFALSTPIIKFEEKDKRYVIETIRSIYTVKKIIEPKFQNTIDELKKYLQSDDFNKLIKVWEKKEMAYAK